MLNSRKHTHMPNKFNSVAYKKETVPMSNSFSKMDHSEGIYEKVQGLQWLIAKFWLL